MKILLHICCAPCAIYPVELIRADGHVVAGYFYNPNIHPYTEYEKRKTAVEEYAARSKLDVVYGDYAIEDFFQEISYSENIKNRCPICWWVRLKKTAELAARNGLDAFTTTLLASPYQDQEVIKEIARDLSEKTGVKFYYRDFRAGFKEAHERAKREGIYCQKYCGCLFSEKERYLSDSRKIKNQK